MRPPKDMDPGRANHWDYQSAQPPLLTSLFILATHMESTEQGWVMFRERGMGCANNQPNLPLCFWFLAWKVAAQSSQSGPPTCPHLPPSLSISSPCSQSLGEGQRGGGGSRAQADLVLKCAFATHSLGSLWTSLSRSTQRGKNQKTLFLRGIP